ncbi:hypothetical protein LguiA_021764 [Lonicera macranthoides]
MEYELSDSSGTDDDLPPSHPNRFRSAGRASGNGRSAVVGTNAPPFPRMHGDMETQIHLIEQEAYSSVLRAFKAQSDAITWEKESLITELRKELRVSDEEHRELLSKVNADDTIRQIREWRKGNGLQTGMVNSRQLPVCEPIPSPTVSASRKKQKTSQSSLGTPSPALHPSLQQPSSSALKRGHVSAGRGKKPKSGRHALVYDISTADETWEWVNLKEISPEDIRWDGEDPGISRRGGRIGSGPGHGFKKSMGRGGAVAGGGRGRGLVTKGQYPKNDFTTLRNGIGKKALCDIEILHTDTLVKEVERVFGASHPDPTEVEKAKKVLKEHEQSLIDAIARLEAASDGESGNH